MPWEGIVIHHSVSGDVPAAEIDRWHRERGFNSIGYHFVIRQNGDIEPGRDWTQAGAHARGRNDTHLGVCLTGNFGHHPPTPAQMFSLIHLARGLCERWGAEEIEEHHQKCPGEYFPWRYFLAAVEAEEG